MELTEENLVFYASRYYCNPNCRSQADFLEDLNRVKYIKRLLKRYQQNGVLCERLILNHIIVFYNVFDTEAATKILFFRIDEEYHKYLKTFLMFLGYLGEEEHRWIETDTPIARILERIGR